MEIRLRKKNKSGEGGRREGYRVKVEKGVRKEKRKKSRKSTEGEV